MKIKNSLMYAKNGALRTWREVTSITWPDANTFFITLIFVIVMVAIFLVYIKAIDIAVMFLLKLVGVF